MHWGLLRFVGKAGEGCAHTLPQNHAARRRTCRLHLKAADGRRFASIYSRNVRILVAKNAPIAVAGGSSCRAGN